MKKLLTLLLVAFLLVAGVTFASESNDANSLSVTGSLLVAPASDRADFEFWFGGKKDKSTMGFIVGYIDGEEDIDPSFKAGVFAEYQLPNLRGAVDNTFWLTSLLPESIEATPSIGLAFTYNFGEYRQQFMPFVGMQFFQHYKLHIAKDLNRNDDTRVGITYELRF